ncbi:MAG TPA: cyclic pyranopterin monophosphate synthase MoaC, partial [Rhizomicrobium sp.]|nr:cyclic pyranopterin monophosphate synthase MoaC [Rhizomicrobium sp.]
MTDLTHLDQKGQARMVDVGDKPVTAREAVAEGRVRMNPQTFKKALEGDSKKGSVRAAAEFAGVMAAKRTADLIPLCHPIPLTSIKVEIAADEKNNAL